MTELSARLEKCQQNKTAELNLSNLSLTAIPEIVGSFIWLKGLYINNNQISDLQPLATLTKLIRLVCRSNQISDLQPLATLTKLTSIFCSGNKISDLQPLATLTELTFLDCENNQISDLQPLATLTELTRLDFDNNQISDLQPLATLTKLYRLDFDNNQISDLQPLATLTELTDFHCDDNPIKGVPAEILKQGIVEIQKQVDSNTKCEIENSKEVEMKVSSFLFLTLISKLQQWNTNKSTNEKDTTFLL